MNCSTKLVGTTRGMGSYFPGTLRRIPSKSKSKGTIIIVTRVAKIIDFTSELASHYIFKFESKLVSNCIRIFPVNFCDKVVIQEYLKQDATQYNTKQSPIGKFLSKY